MKTRSALAMILAALLCWGALGCQTDFDALEAAAQSALGAGQFDEAIAAATDALALVRTESAGASVEWSFERIRLEALARAGRGKEAKEALDSLAQRFAGQVKPALYVATATHIDKADQRLQALDVLHAGDQRFPEDTSLRAEIDKLKADAGSDDDLEEKLKKLGYL